MIGKGWINTIDLKGGDRIASATGGDLTVLSLKPTGKTEQTYNLTVDGSHTFLVGEDRVVVHNALPCKWFNPKFLPPHLQKAINGTLARFNNGARGQPFGNWFKDLPSSGAPYRKLPVENAGNRTRIIQGSDGSRYITFDHYDTFQRIR